MLQFEENDQATKVNSNTFIPKPNIVRIDYNKVLSALHTHIHVAFNFCKAMLCIRIPGGGGHSLVWAIRGRAAG